MMYQQYEKRPPIYNSKGRQPINPFTDTPITGDVAKLQRAEQELAFIQHRRREWLTLMALRGFFILLGVALLTFVIIFPFVAFR